MSKGLLGSSITHRQTHTHESEYRGHTFKVSGIFSSIYHQGSVQYGMYLYFTFVILIIMLNVSYVRRVSENGNAN